VGGKGIKIVLVDLGKLSIKKNYDQVAEVAEYMTAG
jgi:hypothetical protein